jgi:hypothetical protein
LLEQGWGRGTAAFSGPGHLHLMDPVAWFWSLNGATIA